MSDTPHIDGFSDLTLIGRGSSGTVYRAHQDAMNRSVAIKVLQASTTDPNARERFGREVRTLGELSGHPSIVTTYTSGVTGDDRPYLVMDLMESDISAHGPIDVAEAAEMVTAAARGLAEAHRRGVLHRDVKPANIFLDRYGHVRLGDFGLVGLSEAQSITNASVGSPAYMAPELLASSKASVSSDLYALAVTLYWLIEGSLPFEAGDSGVAGLFHTILNRAHRPPERMGGRTTEFIDRALAKDPALRPQSAADFIAELSVAVAADEAKSTTTDLGGVAPTHLAPAPSSSAPSGFAPPAHHQSSPVPVTPLASTSGPGVPPPPATTGVSSSGPYPTPAPGPSPSNGRPKWLIPAGIVAVAVVVVGGLVFLTGGDDTEAAPDIASGVVSIRSTVFGIPDGEEDAVDTDVDSSGFLIEGGYVVTGRAPGVATDFEVTVGGEEVSADLVGTADCSGVSVLRIDEADVAERHLFDWSSGRIGFGNSVRVVGPLDEDDDPTEYETEVVTEPGPQVDGVSVRSSQYDLDVELPDSLVGTPVLDRNDDVAGLVVAVDSIGDVSRSMSVDEVETIVDDIIRTGDDIGIGISFREAGGSVGVRAVRPGSVAEDLGLLPGDEIVDIDEVGMSLLDEPLIDFCEIFNDIGSDEIPLRVRRDQSILVGVINGDELERESNTELDYHEIESTDGALVLKVPTSWEVFQDPETDGYDSSVLSAEGADGFVEFSHQPNRTPQEIIDIFTDVITDTPECSVGATVDYVDGVFTGLEMPVTCTDQPNAVNKLIAATEDSTGDSISLLYSYDGPAPDEVVSQIESTFLLLGN